MSTQIGILGIGTYLPPHVRTNDWWPAATVQRWRDETMGKARPTTPPRFASEGERLASQAMAELTSDPFRGARERRILAPELKASDMEVAAARDALERSGVDASEIDLLLGFSVVPDYLLPCNVGELHRQLGLPERCLSLGTLAACNAFVLQLAIAEGMIASGQARRALLVQSTCQTRIIPPEVPYSAWFGDGATAVVVGEVGDGFGVLGRDHNTDGENHRAVVIGVPGRRWYEAGESRFYQEDNAAALRMMRAIVDRARTSLHAALAQAGHRPEDVDFYACHQGLEWLRRVTQPDSGLTRARTVDTFARFGSLAACNLPLIMSIAERERMLGPGDLVAMFTGGAGEVWSSVILRWGRG